MKRPEKITFGEMRAGGVRGVIVYCADYTCSHSVTLNADRWPDEVRLSDRAALYVSGLRPERRGCAPEFQLGERGAADGGVSLGRQSQGRS